MPRQRTDWSLQSDEWSAFLKALHPDPSRAADRLMRIHQKLVTWFEYNTHSDPRFQADITIDRLVRKVNENAVLAADVERFSLGLARKVRLEQLHSAARLVAGIHPLMRRAESAVDKDCVEYAFSQLTNEERRMIEQYYRPSEPACLAASRKELASSLGISYDDLRARAARIIRRMRHRSWEDCRANRLL